MASLSEKYSRLKNILRSYGSLLVAYSGGVDSTLLLKVAADILGDRVLAITADSPIYPASERSYAEKMARRFGVRHILLRSGALSNTKLVSNQPDRCYWCKRALLEKLNKRAAREGLARVAVGEQRDDLRDYRPGSRAAREAGVVSPLLLTGFTKRDVRELSRRLGIPGWRRDAMACLATRIPYGEKIDREKLARVERAEEFLRLRGLRQVRVRQHGDTARIEVDPSQVSRFSKKKLRSKVVKRLKQIGFLHVCLDLEGYRTGSKKQKFSLTIL
ncbi:MAG: ATP-dependent sacrificial sulfur transferase LarE [Candidatus Aureabacteria bacterium]|nr:ATP-dependent sacrificial sulfur transferase LarE [Candidatus Auribacterota bacterium]